MGLSPLALYNINLDYDKFDEDDPASIVLGRLIAWSNTFKQCKACEKKMDEELVLVLGHPTIVWDWWLTKN